VFSGYQMVRTARIHLVSPRYQILRTGHVDLTKLPAWDPSAWLVPDVLSIAVGNALSSATRDGNGRHQNHMTQISYETEPEEAERYKMTYFCEYHFGPNESGLCNGCGGPLPEERPKWCSTLCSDRHARNHFYNVAREAAIARDGSVCRLCGSQEYLEVHHVVPIRGRHDEPGCHHHVTGLETLCHQCHVRITNLAIPDYLPEEASQ
jgi:5-methylcytosine-specific restriction endonuclease McrA